MYLISKINLKKLEKRIRDLQDESVAESRRNQDLFKNQLDELKKRKFEIGKETQ